MGYEVIAIPKTALDDRDRMAGYFGRIARKLLTKEESDRIKNNPDWFGTA